MRLLQPTLAVALLVSASEATWINEAGVAPLLHRSLATPEKTVLGRSSPSFARLGFLQRKLSSKKAVAASGASPPGTLVPELAVRGGASSKAEVSEEGDDEGEGVDDEEEEEEVEEEEEEEEETDEETAVAVKKLLLDEGPADKVLRVAQAVGKVFGEAHSALAQAPTLGILLTNPMFAQLGASLLMMKLSKKVDYKDAKTLFKIRVFYSSSMLFIQGMYFLIRHAIWRAADTTEVVTSNALVDGLLKATSGDSEESNDESCTSGGGAGGGLAAMAAAATRSVQTAKDYDLKLVKRASAALFPNMCMMYFFHFKRDWHRAVLFAPVGPIIQLFSDPLFQIHILGRRATGPLQRPFKSAQQRLMAEMGAGKEEGDEDGSEGATASAGADDEASSSNAGAEPTTDSSAENPEGAAAKKGAKEESSDKAPRGVVVEDATSDDEGDDDDDDSE